MSRKLGVLNSSLVAYSKENGVCFVLCDMELEAEDLGGFLKAQHLPILVISYMFVRCTKYLVLKAVLFGGRDTIERL